MLKQTFARVGDKIEVGERSGLKSARSKRVRKRFSTPYARSSTEPRLNWRPHVEGAKVTLDIDGVKRSEKIINFKM